MKILVTGSEGFIGSHLMRALGDDGVGFDIKNSVFEDILWEKNQLNWIIETYKPEAIIHLAAISNRQECDKDPQLALETNIVGTYNVLAAAEKHGIKKVIVASSAATYQPELSIYGTSKLSMEALTKMFSNAIIARFYNVYGPGSKSVVNKFIQAIKRSRQITLNGNTSRDYVYVDDVVKTLIWAIKHGTNKTFEVGSYQSTSLKELVKIIEGTLRKKAKVKKGKALREIQHSSMEIDYNTFRSISLEEGIRRLC